MTLFSLFLFSTTTTILSLTRYSTEQRLENREIGATYLGLIVGGVNHAFWFILVIDDQGVFLF